MRLYWDRDAKKWVERDPNAGETDRTAAWPVHMYSLACHPSQISQMEAAYREAGVEVKHDAAGRPIALSQKHMNAIGALHNKFNLDTGEGRREVEQQRQRCGNRAAEGRRR